MPIIKMCWGAIIAIENTDHILPVQDLQNIAQELRTGFMIWFAGIVI